MLHEDFKNTFWGKLEEDNKETKSRIFTYSNIFISPRRNPVAWKVQQRTRRPDPNYKRFLCVNDMKARKEESLNTYNQQHNVLALFSSNFYNEKFIKVPNSTFHKTSSSHHSSTLPLLFRLLLPISTSSSSVVQILPDPFYARQGKLFPDIFFCFPLSFSFWNFETFH